MRREVETKDEEKRTEETNTRDNSRNGQNNQWPWDHAGGPCFHVWFCQTDLSGAGWPGAARTGHFTLGHEQREAQDEKATKMAQNWDPWRPSLGR